jgi:cytochrome c biogenesis protein
MTKKRSEFYNFFTSIRLAIVLLSAIALGALLGTVIPQQAAAEAFSSRLHPALLAVLQALQLFDIYHSAWFILLLVLLAINLIACSLDRFPAAWRQIRSGTSPERPELFTDLPPNRSLTSERSSSEAAGRVEMILRKHCRKVRKAETDQGIFLAGEKGGFSRLGVYVVHAGILLMIAGGLAGAVFGLRGHVEIAEGETADTLHIGGGKAAKPLDFKIRCDRFTVEHYENGAPKTFRSDLTFLRGDRVEKQGALLVNHPIAFGGLRFYQSSYGVLPGGRLELAWTKGAEKEAGREAATPGDRFALPGGSAQVEVLRVEDDLMRMGPAVKLSVTAGADTVQFWVFQNIEKIKEANPGILSQVPLMNPGLFAPYLFSLQKTGERFYTVLQAAHDPGAPLVAGGAGLMMTGLMITFFFSHRRLFIRVEERKCQSLVAVAGTSNRDPVGLEGELKRLLAKIRETEGRS